MSVNTGMDTTTVDKLYAMTHVAQPQAINEKPIPYHHMGTTITELDVLVNSTVAQKTRNDVAIENHHIWGDVYVTYTELISFDDESMAHSTADALNSKS
jgi:hypothetical protein